MEPFLRARGVTRRFGAVTAVDGADLDVAPGSLHALLGPSGCGKTTLLRLIGGLDVPDAGTIEVEGRRLNGPDVFVPPERRQVVMVFQDLALFPHMDAAKNVAFGVPRGVDRRRRVMELLELVGLAGLQRRMPHELSGGQQQRVALARALAAEPRMILLDEPFSNLDPAIRGRVRLEVRSLLREVGITAVFVTHDQDEALSLADAVSVMIEGRILQTGTPAEIYARPTSRQVAEFVGNANVVRGLVADSMVTCALGRFPAPAVREGPADVVIRTEMVALGLESGVPAEVKALDFYGHDQVITVALADGALIRALRPPQERYTVGQAVGVVVRGEVLALPAER